jgi:hypothetical protein
MAITTARPVSPESRGSEQKLSPRNEAKAHSLGLTRNTP